MLWHRSEIFVLKNENETEKNTKKNEEGCHVRINHRTFHYIFTGLMRYLLSCTSRIEPQQGAQVDKLQTF